MPKRFRASSCDAGPSGFSRWSKKARARRNATIACSRSRTAHPSKTDQEDVRKLPDRAREETTNALEEKQIDFLGWRGPGPAINTIKRLAEK
jgi:inorganic pyrophosphatase